MNASLYLIVLSALLASSATHAGEPDAALLASSCTGCHGVEGRARGSMPGLAAMPVEQFTTRMKAFKAASTPATVMNRIATGYSDAEIAQLATYFARQKP